MDLGTVLDTVSFTDTDTNAADSFNIAFESAHQKIIRLVSSQDFNVNFAKLPIAPFTCVVIVDFPADGDQGFAAVTAAHIDVHPTNNIINQHDIYLLSWGQGDAAINIRMIHSDEYLVRKEKRVLGFRTFTEPDNTENNRFQVKLPTDYWKWNYCRIIHFKGDSDQTAAREFHTGRMTRTRQDATLQTDGHGARVAWSRGSDGIITVGCSQNGTAWNTGTDTDRLCAVILKD